MYFNKHTYIYNFILYYFQYIGDLEIIESYESDKEIENESDNEIYLE
jgi:hypothetical protein